MSNHTSRAVDRALEIRREVLHELKHGKLSRRAMHRKLLAAGGALAALGALGGRSAMAGDLNRVDVAFGFDSGPRTKAFIEELPHPNRPEHVKKTETLTSEPTEYPNTSAGGSPECRRDKHQAWLKHWANVPADQRRTYVLRQKLVKARIHRDLPEQDFFACDGKIPGPTFHSRYGVPAMVRLINELPDIGAHKGFGCPETAMHLHNGHVPSESDGYPDDYLPRQRELDPTHADKGRWRDHHYPNMYAGDDPREALGTLWYHDHRHDFTSQNVYRGLAGFHLMFDKVDSGDENDYLNPDALRLPSGEYDLPLALMDRYIDSNGVIQFDQFNFDGIIGNKYLVNGKIQPFFKAKSRKYRLRILGASVSRTYGLAFYMSDSPDGPINATPLPAKAAQIISTGGNLLPAPIPMRNPTPLGGAGRIDVVVDFKQVIAAGKKYVYLVNRWEQTNGREPKGYRGSGPNGVMFDNIPGAGDALMRFEVDPTVVDDPSRVPAKLRELPWDPNDALGQLTERQILDAVGKDKPFPGVANVRHWKFDRTNGMWAVNGKLFDGSEPAAKVGLGTGEIWVLEGSGSWVHPVHLHQEEHRTLFRSGRKPQAGDLEYGRDDTMLIGGGERGILFRRFRDFKGKYVMHCHNTVHEDHAMMIRWDIV